MSEPTQPLSTREAEFLLEAARYLENPSLVIRLAQQLGLPLEKLASRVVPAPVASLADRALRQLLATAITTIPAAGPPSDQAFHEAYESSGWTGVWHQLATMGTGFAGGMFGLSGLAVELPITTGILFRSIASIADHFGEDLSDPAVRLECLTVFGQAGPAGDETGRSTWMATRLAMTELVNESARFIARSSVQAVVEGLSRGTAPLLIRFLSRLVAPFSVAVSEKFLAQSLPVFGAAGGAAINAAFADHFNTTARFHFGIRKLERHRGAEVVRDAYAIAVEETRGTVRTLEGR
jgi:hypothetical protein